MSAHIAGALPMDILNKLLQFLTPASAAGKGPDGLMSKPSLGKSPAVPQQEYVMFYNLENLYDTVDDPKTNDDEYTPTGAKRWTMDKYRKKLSNLSDVFSAIATDKGRFPAVVGVSEVENDSCLRDLCNQQLMRRAGYRFIHYDSGDERGVDVALLYRPDVFLLQGSKHITLKLRSGRQFLGRDILVVWGLLHDTPYCFYVCHLPSRRAGVDASQGFRRAGAETVRDDAVEMRRLHPGIKVVVMGDMNDNPDDESLRVLLGAGREISDALQGGWYNPFWHLYDQGKGSSRHRGRWMMFDNIIVDGSVCSGARNQMLLSTIGKHHGEVFCRPFMMLKSGEPKRSYVGDNFKNGYSDHLPILIKLESGR